MKSSLRHQGLLLSLVAAMTLVVGRSYRIGIVGGGVVGGGIAGIIESRSKALKEASGATLELKSVCVRDLKKKRDWTPPEGCELVDDASKIVGNKDIDLVVEVAGGTTEAKDVVFGALKAGQDVVTANKALIAAYMPEIDDLLKASPAVQFGFEAAVMGGIPIIHALQNDFVGDRISSMQGIMNGCTNFMLTKMAATGCSYEDILGEAQELGYAEADPTLDVGGQDARSKLKILIKLAFGLEVEEDAIPCAGITEITATDFAYAKMMGGTIKLLGFSELSEDGKSLSAFVAPAFVPSAQVLASIGGATNAVEVMSENLGSTLLVGQGAGRFPTANSCVNDIARCAEGSCKGSVGVNRAGASDDLSFTSDYSAGFYLRCEFDQDAPGITRQLGEVCEQHGVSINSMLQLPNTNAFVIITDRTSSANMKEVVDELAAKSWHVGTPYYMPVVPEP
jgi:homoserine dehydrogenase